MIDYNRHTFKSPEYRSVVSSAVSFFESTPIMKFPVSEEFFGAGVYGLYYKGNYQLYKKYLELNTPVFKVPIYIGKAVPGGWRKGRTNLNKEKTTNLLRRLREHENSISYCEELKVQDFSYRFVILGEEELDLISTIESTLIRKYKPLWNNVVDGFGNHTPGEGRFEQARSEWDVLHRGRPWANRCRGKEPDIKMIKEDIAEYFS
jgi:hypothetical protein